MHNFHVTVRGSKHMVSLDLICMENKSNVNLRTIGSRESSARRSVVQKGGLSNRRIGCGNNELSTSRDDCLSMNTNAAPPLPSLSQGEDPTYEDPLGPSTERPRTAARRKRNQGDFVDEEVDDSMLPD